MISPFASPRSFSLGHVVSFARGVLRTCRSTSFNLLGLAFCLSLLACGGDSGASADDAGGSSRAQGSDLEGGASGPERQDGGANPGRAEAGVDANVNDGNASSARDASTANARDAAASSDASGSSADAGVKADSGGAEDASGMPHFSFFVTSQDAIVDLAKDAKGFGGDLRYGETGSGAGLRGADKICTEIAERSMPGSGAKQWHAFLSASTGGADGGALNARDRIGAGPWYDRKGRLVGNALADLISGDRPSGADPAIRDDLPNETGTPNRAPNGTQLDDHDTLTGSDANGRYVSGSNTCQDWTSASTASSGGGDSGPSIGHSWPRSASSGRNWISDHRAGGCGQGINTSNGTSDGTPTVGSGGGYGGFYCFALQP